MLFLLSVLMLQKEMQAVMKVKRGFALLLFLTFTCSLFQHRVQC